MPSKSKHKPISLEEAMKRLHYTKADYDYIETEASIMIAAMELRRARKLAKLTQAKLSTISGVDRTTISKIENGVRDIPVGKLAEIAAAMGKRLEVRVV